MKSWWKTFTSQQEEVDRALRAAAPSLPRPDPELHRSIMRAVRARGREEERRRAPAVAWWVSGAVAASLAVAGAWYMSRPPAPAPQKLAATTEMAAAPGAALDLGAQMPALLMSPLTNEMARVDEDLHNTTQVLLQSFP